MEIVHQFQRFLLHIAALTFKHETIFRYPLEIEILSIQLQ